MHTTETDGRATLEEMAEAARERGYEYIAITDHSKALAMTNGLDEKRAVAFARRVREINRDGLGIRIFSGIECDILKDGAMDLADDALAELDLVIGSVHSHMNLESAEMTDRLLRALECPHLRILGHPTGRMLLHRDPFPFDFDRVVAEAVRRGVWLEINASPERLDLHGTLIRTAKAKGAKFTISTDAHHPKHLANMRYGVVTARRGWLGPDDILNTRGADEFAARHPSKIMKITSFQAGIRLRPLPRHRGRGGRSQDEIRDQAQRRAPHRQRGDDGRRREEAHAVGAPVPPARREVSLGTARRPPRPRREALAGRQARIEGGDRLRSAASGPSWRRSGRAPASCRSA